MSDFIQRVLLRPLILKYLPLIILLTSITNTETNKLTLLLEREKVNGVMNLLRY